MKKSLIFTLSLLASSAALATGNNSALSIPGYFGNINNNTGYVVECSQVVGGYCANNPMPADGYIQMLPDPGSTQIRGHVMVFDKSTPGTYVDNIVFNYSEQKDGSWKFQMESLYHKTTIKALTPDTILLSKGATQ